MSKNKICIPINNLIRKIAKLILGETPKSVSNLITTYYDYHNIDPSIDDNTEYPSAEELTKFRDSIRNTPLQKSSWARKAEEGHEVSTKALKIEKAEKNTIWTREKVSKDNRTLYIFTDNTDRNSGSNKLDPDSWYAKKYGADKHFPTQTSAVLRGLDNARPISTQRWYNQQNKGVTGRWTDESFEEFKKIIDEEFEDIKEAWESGKFDKIVLPHSFFNTRISNISKERTPKIQAYLQAKVDELSSYNKSSELNEATETLDRAFDINTFEAPKIPLKELKQLLYRDFTAREKLDRVNLVSDLFSDSLDAMMQEELELYNNLIKLSQEEGDHVRHLELLNQKENVTRYSLIVKYGPQKVFEKVKEHLTDFMNMSSVGLVEYLMQELELKGIELEEEALQKLAIKYAAARNISFQKILNNFELIAFESTRNLLVTENIRFSPYFRELEENKTRVLEENKTRELDENGVPLFTSEDAYEMEEEIKEGWMDQFREVSASQSLSEEVKQYISSVKKTDLDGNLELDDLGFIRKLNPAYVHASLLDALHGITTPKDMMIRLEEMAITKPWVDLLLIDLETDELDNTSSEYSKEENAEIEKLNEEISKDNEKATILKSKFFKNYNKDFSYYWVQNTKTNSSGVTTTRTIPVNKPNGTFFLLSSWRDNYQAGYKLSKSSIYDTNANILKENAKLQFRKLQLLQLYLNANNKTPLSEIFEFGSDQFNTLIDLLNSIGINIDDVGVFDAILLIGIEDKKSNIIRELTRNLSIIFKGVIQDKIKDTTAEDGTVVKGDLLNEFSSAYETLAKELSNLNDDAIEASFRENGKSYFSFTSPNLTKKTINKLKDVMNNPEAWEEFMEKTYFKYDWFMNNLGEILNHWIAELYTDENARELLDHKVLLNRDRVEYSDQSPEDYSKVLVTEYFSDPNAVKNPNNAYAWYYIPVMSDASTSEFIKFKRYTKDGKYQLGDKIVGFKEFLLDKFANIVSQEYNRMIDVADVFIGNLKGEGTKTVANIDIKLDTSKIPQAEIDNLIDRYENDDTVSKVVIVQEFIQKHSKNYNKSIGGLEFKFLPYLNNPVTVDGESHSVLNILNIADMEGTGTVLRESLNNILENAINNEFEKEYKNFANLGLFKTTEKGELINFPGIKSDKILNSKLINALKLIKQEYSKDGYWRPAYEKLLNNLVQGNPIIKETVDIILDNLQRDISQKALLNNKYDKLHSRVIESLLFKSEIRDSMEEYFYNSTFATSLIILILATDLAYFKNPEDFQKRFKMYYSPAERLNTDSKYGRTIERSIYLSDLVIPAPTFSLIELIFSLAVSEGRITVALKVAALSHYTEIEATDGQAYRSPFSMRAVMDMAGEWTPELERAFQNFKENKFDARDLEVIVLPIKQFTASNISHELNNGSVRRVPTQHKNSELLLMSSFLMAGVLNKSPQLRALMDFLEESFDPNNPDSGIDVIQFNTAVKVGNLSAINIMDLENYQDIKDRLHSEVYDENGDYKIEVVHEIPYEEYGIQVATPDHHLDTSQLIGTQLRKLVPANMHPDTLIKIPGKKEPVKFSEWFKEYNKVIVSNVIKDYESTRKLFDTKESVEEILLDEILSNDRYGMDLFNACTLETIQNKDGSVTKDFTAPLFDPAQVNRTMSLINSIIKSRITKQKIKGGSLIQATNFGFTEDLLIRYKNSEGDLILTKKEFGKKFGTNNLDSKYEQYLVDNKAKSIAYFEAYMPWYSKEYLEPLLNENNQLDADNLPEDLRKLIAYRVPTEDAYSMFPIRIKGFTPPQNGGIIMLPTEIVDISGSDFDIDKLYIFLPEFNILTIDHRRAKADFIQANKGNNELITALLGELEFSENEEYQEFLKINKDKYELEKPIISKIKYKEELGLKNSRAAFNNRFIDLIWEKMTHELTAARSLKPGGFENIRHSADILRSVENLSLEDILLVFPQVKNYKGAVDAILGANKSQLSSLSLITMGAINPLAPSTQLKFLELNMTGKKLVAIFAVHNSHNALMQHTKLELDLGDTLFLILNGKTFESLHSIKNDIDEYIANNVASLLAAAVDNAKDPLLSFLNLNIDTANAGSLLVRLGYSTTEVGALFNQPIIKDTYRLLKENRSKGMSIEVALSLTYKKYEDLLNILDDKASETPMIGPDYALEDLLQSIMVSKNLSELSNNDKNSYILGQLAVLDLYNTINAVGKDLSDLSSVHKADTLSGGAGPSIAHTINKLLDIKKIYAKVDAGKFSLRNVKEIINLDISDKYHGLELLDKIMESPIPFLQGFFTLGLLRTEEMLNKYFPFYRSDFLDVISEITNNIKYDKINPKIMNDIFNDMLSYYLLKINFFGNEYENGVTSKEKRDVFVNKFPDFFALKFKENKILQENEFIRRINYNKADLVSSVPYLTFKNVGSLDLRLKDLMGLAWESLLYSGDSDARRIGNALIKYSYFRNGFAFGPLTFMHLINTNIKQLIPGYIEALRDLQNYKDDFSPFIDQFFRNNLNNPILVPSVGEEIPAQFSKSMNKMVININKYNLSKFFPILKNGLNEMNENVTTGYVKYTYKNKPYYYKMHSQMADSNNAEVMFIRVQPLGIMNLVKEYEYGSLNIQSVLKTNEVKNLVNQDYLPYADLEYLPTLGKDTKSENIKDKVDLVESLTEAVELVLGLVTDLLGQLKETLSKKSLKDIDTKNINRDDEGNPICK